jgi:hypothetical protein
MSDKSWHETYYCRRGNKDNETVETNQPAPDVQHLQRLLAGREHAAFLSAFESDWMQTSARYHDYLQALGGEGLCLLFEETSRPSKNWANRYGALLLAEIIVAPAEVIAQLATLLCSTPLTELAVRKRKKEVLGTEHVAHDPRDGPHYGKSRQTILQVRRVVQIMQMVMGDGQYSGTNGICRSIFRSPQERTFLRALSLRFPGLQALPNYPLDQIVALDRVVAIDAQTLRYGRNCRLDAVLIVPDEGDPVAVFELDSRFHDLPKIAGRDAMKNSLLAASGLPFFRLRAESPESMSIDEWYALLSDQVLPHIDLGNRIRCRQAAYSLIPC